MLMWKKGYAYILPKVKSLKSGMKRPGTGKQRNSSISEMSGNHTHRDKSSHVERGHILLYLLILMTPFLMRGTALITWSPSGLHSIIQGGL